MQNGHLQDPWLNTPINLWAITIVACIPLFISIVPVLKKIVQPTLATKYAIRNAIAGFLAVIIITGILLV